MKLPPGPKGHRLHNLRQRTENYGAFADQLRREYGEVVSFELPFMKCCVVFDAELVREVLVTQQQYFRPWFPGDVTDDWKYGSISLHQGEEHRRRAEFMTSVFAGDSEGAYAEIIAEQATVLRERLSAGQGVDLVKEFERFAWDAIVEIVLGRGVELPRQLGEDTLTLQKMYLLLDILPGPRLFKSLPLPVLRRGRKSVGLVDAAIYGAMQRARDSGYSGRDVVAQYVRALDLEGAAGGLDSDRAIRDELIILLTGFIDAPTAVMLPKEATEDRVLGDYLIPKGTLVHVAMRALHHRPEHWDQPSDFRPERWLENPRPPCPAHAYIPFGLGPHFCQGMDIARRIFVFGTASLANRLRLEPRSTDPPNRNDTAVGVVGPWTADVHERRDSSRLQAGEQHA
ncbi:MAG: cytochrome P450 [Acidobacteriota bacterium]|nr:cytochrome P450 [Acidobacteriota bacterium]MDE3264557.1 cytochrome P450 [Acidobacteriota bacterium]